MKGLNIEGFLFSFLNRDLLPAVWRASDKVTGILKCRNYNLGSKGKTRTWMLRQEITEGERWKNLIKHFKGDDLGCNPGEEAYPGWNVFISSPVLHTAIPHSWACVHMTKDSPVSGEGAEGREDSELRAQILLSASSQSIDLFLLHYYLYGAVRKGWRTPMLFHRHKHRKFFLDQFISSFFPSNDSLCVYTSATEIKVCVHRGF